MKKRSVNYLCLQATKEGQASYAHVHEIIKGLESRGWSVTLFEPPYAKSKDMPGAFGRLLWFLLIQLKMWLSPKPEVIYIRNHFASWPSALIARILKIPVVQEVNGPYQDLFIAWPATRYAAGIFKYLIRSQLRWADAVIAVTPGLAEWVKKETGNTNVWVIPNGANTDLFKPEAPLDCDVELPQNFVVFFGALAPWQGIDTMLEAVQCPEWPNEVKLVIAGNGVERPKIEALRSSGKILYLGSVPYRCVPGIVARSIAGISPKNTLAGGSGTGLFPLKVLETLACGVPVVVTDFPGVAELVKKNKCGIVIPPENPKALAEAVKFLYENPEERAKMGQRGREMILKEHSWKHRAELTEQVLYVAVKKTVKDDF